MKLGWVLTLACVFLPISLCLSATDSVSDADPAQSGYLPNHNINPLTLSSTPFKTIWNRTFHAKEIFYAKPLVYTPPSTNRQLVFLASSQNRIHTLDALDGKLISFRQLQTPFDASEVDCQDTVGSLGVTGTPVIDPKTDTAYFFVKTYIPNFRVAGNTGLLNGVYYFYAINVVTLQDVQGFPVLIDETIAQNDPLRYFHGGLTVQRTSMTMVNGVVFGAFSGHCDKFNYTGMVIGVSTTAKRVVSAFAMEAGSGTKHDKWDVLGGGGQAGIWMSGMAPATLGDGRIFLVTGNGQGQFNKGSPASGQSGLKTLDECIVNMAVSASGKLSVSDYFEPQDYISLDSQDADLGSGGIALLDRNYFNGSKVLQVGIVVGKSGKIYVVDANNLGGYKGGVGQSDAVLQTLQMPQGVWGGCGSYPLEGGYIYCSPISSNTFVFKFSKDKSGNPVFTQVATSKEMNAFGVGQPTITSFNGQVGTGILWSTDPVGGIRAWSALPGSNAMLKSIPLPKIPGIWKFQRPAFGNGKLYVLDANSTIHCIGT